MSSSFALPPAPAQDHLRLAPPREGHWLGPVGLALLAHGVLVAALTWGVSWKQDADVPVFEAELWSRLPVQAAPRAEAPPPPPPTPEPEARLAPPRPAPPPPGPSEAEIATQRAQQKKAEEQRALQEARDKARAEKAAAEKKAAEKAAAEKKATEKKAAEQKAAEKKATDEKRAKERAEAEAAERLRQDNIRRMLGQAGASGGPQSTGTAQQSSGPSPSYGGKVAARIKPNVVFTDAIAGNPRAEVEVRTLPDGTIVGRRLVKSSGNPAWDDAVLKAIDRTATLPRDTDGRVPASLIIGLRPQD